jgi:leucine dehydrogenase
LIIDLNKSSKLKGYIVIYNHRTPSLGGTRIAVYKSSKHALADAIKLAEAMAYKCAMAGLPFGGAKGVIINNSRMPREEMLKEYALQVDKLKGKFYTGEDVGIEEEDVQYMLKFSPYFVGKTGFAGDPSYFAALSAFDSIKVALKFVFKNSKISDHSFAIKGVGKTGNFLAKLLAFAGGKVFVSDLDKNRIKKLISTHKNIHAGPKKIDELEVDVLCPCALGNDITKKNINKIKAKIIAGTANNQVHSLEIGDSLFKRGIIQIPDYIANSGGLIDVADELMPGGYNRKRVLRSIEEQKSRLLKVLNRSKKEKVSPVRIANELVENIFIKSEKVNVSR